MFQSTHPHGVRRATSDLQRNITCFNPRTHTGCDFAAFQSDLGHQNVSIHAPTRGATCLGNTLRPPCQGFNPRTHTGCDMV